MLVGKMLGLTVFSRETVMIHYRRQGKVSGSSNVVRENVMGKISWGANIGGENVKHNLCWRGKCHIAQNVCVENVSATKYNKTSCFI